MTEKNIKFHFEDNKIVFDETRLLLNGDEVVINYSIDGNTTVYDVNVELKRRTMKRYLLYRAKGYDGKGNNIFQISKFNTLIAADSFAEAAEIAYQLAGPNGCVESIKNTNKEVIIKGETENDQSE